MRILARVCVALSFVFWALLAHRAHASAMEAPPLVLPGDVPAELPPNVPAWVAYLLPALGLFMVSLVASFWSDYVRRKGKSAPAWMLSLSAALNVAAGNPHKALRAAKAAKPPEAS